MGTHTSSYLSKPTATHFNFKFLSRFCFWKQFFLAHSFEFFDNFYLHAFFRFTYDRNFSISFGLLDKIGFIFCLYAHRLKKEFS
jgi:hypothetical protein